MSSNEWFFSVPVSIDIRVAEVERSRSTRIVLVPRTLYHMTRIQEISKQTILNGMFTVNDTEPSFAFFFVQQSN